MTVYTTTSSKTFPGNGGQSFPCDFRIFDDTNVEVQLVKDADGTATTLVLNTDYTISGEGDAAGFTLATTNPVAIGYTLTVERVMPYEQPTDFTNQGSFFPSMHEDMADRLEMQIQQVSGRMDRCLVANLASGNYSANGHSINDVADAVNPQDVPSLHQVQKLITDGAVPGLSGDAGSSLVGFKQSGASAVSRTLQDKVREARTAKDNGATGDGAANDGPSMASAITDYSGVRFSPGTYLTTDTNVTLGFDDVAIFDHGADITTSGTGAFTNGGTVIRYGYNPDGITATGSGSGKSNAIGLYVDKHGYGKTSFSGTGREFAIVGAINRPSTSGTSAWAIGGYAKGNGVVALYGQADAAADTSTMWGLNTRTIDNGLHVTQMWGIEVDVNVTYAGNQCLGVDVVGGSTVAPSGVSAAYRVGPIGAFQNPVIPWGRGLFIDDGAATTGIEIGAAMKVGNTGAVSIGGPPIDCYYIDAAGNRVRAITMAVQSDGSYKMRSTPNDKMIIIAATTGGASQDNIKIYQNKVGLMCSGNPGFALDVGGTTRLQGNIGFYNATPIAKQTVSGSRGSNAALTSLLNALNNLGLITDSSS